MRGSAHADIYCSYKSARFSINVSLLHGGDGAPIERGKCTTEQRVTGREFKVKSPLPMADDVKLPITIRLETTFHLQKSEFWGCSISAAKKEK